MERGREGQRERAQILSSVSVHVLPPSSPPTGSGVLSLPHPYPELRLPLIVIQLCSLWKLEQVK